MVIEAGGVYSMVGLLGEKPAIDEVIDAVCKAFLVPRAELLGKTRKQWVVNAKKAVCFILNKCVGLSQEEISTQMRWLERTTISHHVKHVEDMMRLRDAKSERVLVRLDYAIKNLGIPVRVLEK